MSMALIVLAAGKGTRMKSDSPKVLHRIAQAPMLWHALRAGQALEPARTVVVAGHGAEAVEASALDYDPEIRVVIQSEQLGTGHAVRQAEPALQGFEGDAIVLYGDTPFLSEETLAAMQAARQTHDVVVLGFEAADPGRYGRLKMAGDQLDAIVEFKDASDEERAITLCNSGVMAMDAGRMMALLAKVSNDNAAGEYYLTDLVGLARAEGLTATAVVCDEAETMGINSRPELAAAEQAFQARARAALLENGVALPAPETVHLALGHRHRARYRDRAQRGLRPRRDG
ncbi:NTP transferase domain-containing protein [Ponticoccus litoralis]|uniref:NTP transferase domain-containing protein n=1 Tax=Ponticoccus litoralis TaxID=422297 RepID=A0AAW9SN09_9RHOB